MSRALSSALAVALLLAAAMPVVASEPELESQLPSVAGEIVPGQVVVKWRDEATAPAKVAEHGLSVMAELGTAAASLPEVLSTEGRPVAEVVAELSADPAVEYAEPNYVVALAEEPSVAAVGVNDPKTGPQYSLDRMRVRDAWAITTGAAGTVAVLDTGVDFGHPDLAGRILPGHDFVNNDSSAADDNGHGTWVSGIIAANANDGIGIAGVSWRDRILPVKIMNAQGTGDTSDLTAGIVWAADHGATIINMSVGGFPYSQYVHDAVRYAWSRDVVLIGAAGNSAVEGPFYPASYPEVVSVSATQIDDEFSNWSNYGPDVDVSAPGTSVLTTNCPVCKPIEQDISGDHRYTYISGTSFAAPNVAGVVALIRARHPSMPNGQVVNLLKSSVDDLGYAGWDSRYGHGRVNALRAVGGSAATIPLGGGDNLEYDNTLAAARPVALGATLQPNIYPAGDVDVLAIDVPRAGRLDVTVVPVVDNRPWPWHKNSLAVDVVLNMYHGDGTHIATVDAADPAAIDRGSVQMGGAGRILLRVHNYTPNGNRNAYTISTVFVDNVGPLATITYPGAGATSVSRFADGLVSFNEAVSNVTAGTVLMRDLGTGALVPANVTYDAAQRQAYLSPTVALAPLRQHRVEVTSGLTDSAGNPVGATSLVFTTGSDHFEDTVGSIFATEIEWLATQNITQGCSDVRFCPGQSVTREQMASFLARAMGLPSAGDDYFSDDETSTHEVDINRVAAAGVTGGCGGTRYCPRSTVTREQMASFLARALNLAPTVTDFFTDDEQSPHEVDINRLAAAGLASGCGGGGYCPSGPVTREQMAAFLYRAFNTP